MTVCDDDTMTAEGRGQRSRTRRRNGLVQTEVFDRNARALQLTREPPFTVRRQEDDALTTGRLKSSGQVDDDTFGTTRAVGLDQLSDRQHGISGGCSGRRADLSQSYGKGDQRVEHF